MRTVILSCFFCVASLGQPRTCLPESTQGLAYPPKARLTSNLIRGIVQAKFKIDERGRADDVSFPVGHKTLLSAVQDFLVQTMFPRECANTEIDLRFDFQLREERDLPDMVMFDIPRTYVVRASPIIFVPIDHGVYYPWYLSWLHFFRR